MAFNLDKIQQLSKIYRDVLASSIESAAHEAEKAAIFKEVKIQLGGYLSERAITDLNFLINSKTSNLNLIDYSFIIDIELRRKLEFNNKEALRCLSGLNRDGKDFDEYTRIVVIQIELLLVFYFIEYGKSKIKFVNKEVALTINKSPSKDSEYFLFAPIKESESPNLHTLIVIYVCMKFSCFKKTVLKYSEEAKYLSNLMHLKDIRNSISHDGLGNTKNSWVYEVKNCNFNFVSSFLIDVSIFVKREIG